MKKFYITLFSFSCLYSFNVTFFSKTKGIIIDSVKVIKSTKLFNSEIKILPNFERFNFLVDYALKTNRIKYSESFIVKKIYSNIDKGDDLLRKCLLNSNCNPIIYGKLLEKYKYNYIYYKLLLKHPEFNEVNLYKAAGNVSEYVMNKYFTKTGWKKIEGEIGSNGIDGLFVKFDRQGNIKDILFVESKFNKSNLGNTLNGKQMSKKWILNKLEQLKNYPSNSENQKLYGNLIKLVENNNYKSRLWQMKVRDNKLQFSLKKIESDSDNISLNYLSGGEKYKINYQNNQEISLTNPDNKFQKEIINWLNEGINRN